ncbi:MAG: hypothetical protein ACLFRB_07195 [Thiohalorhabdus sp.]|uniref:hypothetical protein n=1 Tax=Thiohalorhabdus sp. TaxID=3094134 RepID=UPI0039816A7B
MATLNDLDEVLRETVERLAALGEGDSEVTDRYLKKALAQVSTLRTNLALEAGSRTRPPGGHSGDPSS